MASSLLLIVVLCLTSGLWIGANASCEDGCCRTCPSGWTLFDLKCYQFHQIPRTWADAERFCTTLGGNLASIHTQGGYEVLRKWIKRTTGTHTNTWVGGYDSSGEGVWLNSDGSLFDFQGWAKGEPNNVGGNEHCMEINFTGKDFVNDIPCDQKKAFVCARDLSSTPLLDIPTVVISQPY